MGNEFGQWTEWDSNSGLDWALLSYPAHDSLRNSLSELLKIYRQTPALWEQDFQQNGFEWIDANDSEQSVFSYIRWDENGSDPVLIILNLCPVVREAYRIGVPEKGEWQEIFNSDQADFGGSGVLNTNNITTENIPFHGRDNSITLRLPPLGAIILKLKKLP